MNCTQCGGQAITPEISAAVVISDEDAPQTEKPFVPVLILRGKPVCRVCAHNASHLWPLEENQIPSPVIDEDGNVIPYGTYPNIDWS
jgi:hypothetical protein